MEENQYLNLVQKVIEEGEERNDRTGVGTISLFAPPQLRFRLDKHFPLLTTKRVFFRGVAEELFWFLGGNTSAVPLQQKGIKIWDGNASREFLDKRGLFGYEAGELGPVYGYQWRHFGAEYPPKENSSGVDQIAKIIHLIKNEPTSRRIILSAWNPKDEDKMALPPCHILCQFYVSSGNRLSCQMYQRSCDLGLGVPFNIASYALLTCLIAHCTDTIPYEFIHCMGDAHVYSNHIWPLKEQITRTPTQFPTLKITSSSKNIDDLSFDDLELKDYFPQKNIKMEMAA